MYNILIAEDDTDIVKILTLYLNNDDMNVVEVHDGTQAMEKMEKEHIDLAIVDIMMPGMDGYELTKRIRSISNIPILLLSAKVEDADKILGLDMGADDYMTKPFNPLEVVARVKSNLRRYYKLNEIQTEPAGPVLKVRDLVLDMGTCTLECRGKSVPLTSTEYKILQLFMKHPGRIFTKMQIYENAIGDSFGNDENTIMVHISRLRDKIETDVKNPQYIKTVRGLGYKIEKD